MTKNSKAMKQKLPKNCKRMEENFRTMEEKVKEIITTTDTFHEIFRQLKTKLAENFRIMPQKMTTYLRKLVNKYCRYVQYTRRKNNYTGKTNL